MKRLAPLFLAGIFLGCRDGGGGGSTDIAPPPPDPPVGPYIELVTSPKPGVHVEQIPTGGCWHTYEFVGAIKNTSDGYYRDPSVTVFFDFNSPCTSKYHFGRNYAGIARDGPFAPGESWEFTASYKVSVSEYGCPAEACDLRATDINFEGIDENDKIYLQTIKIDQVK
jgi:hypothetical protein